MVPGLNLRNAAHCQFPVPGPELWLAYLFVTPDDWARYRDACSQARQRIGTSRQITDAPARGTWR
jgi:hypothetical protein